MALALFGLAAVLLVSDAKRGAIASLCAVACAFFGNIDRIVSFRASPTGFEAKMREVTEVVDEAKATLKSLHTVAAMAGAILIDLNAGMGRWGGGTTLAMKDARRERILAALKDVGLAPDLLAEVSVADREWVKIDYVLGIFANWPRDRKLSPDEDAVWLDFSKPWRGTEAAEWPSPDECGAFMDKLNINDPGSRELLQDYRNYMKKGKHRRPDVWRDRASWDTRRAG